MGVWGRCVRCCWFGCVMRYPNAVPFHKRVPDSVYHCALRSEAWPMPTAGLIQPFWTSPLFEDPQHGTPRPMSRW